MNVEKVNSDTGAYTVESQTVYNCRPRAAVVLIDKTGKDILIRRQDTFEDLISYETSKES